MIVLFLIQLCVGGVLSDYNCLCNYNVELSVYPSKSTSGMPFGYLYEFDCKPLINDDYWATIAFEHRVGYVEKDGQTNIQICSGSIPLADKLFTTTTTTTTLQPTTSRQQPTTSTQQPTTSTQQPTTSTQRPTTSTQQPTTSTQRPTTSTQRPTTSTQQPTTSTQRPTTSTQRPTTSTQRPTTSTQQPTTPTQRPTTSTQRPTTSTQQPTTSTRQPTTSTQQHTTSTQLPTTSTYQQTTSTQLPTTSTYQQTTSTQQHTTSTQLPTTSTQRQTTWTTPTTPTQPSTTHRPTVTVNSTSLYGTVTCPRNVLYSNSNHQLFTSYAQQKCYELVILPKHSWSYGENECKSKGGHLVSIRNAEEESIIRQIVGSYAQPVWIGLHDQISNGQFQWSSGQPLTYQNWSPTDHKNNSCVTIDPGTGTWNSTTCQLFRSYICEYDGVISGQSMPPTTPSVTTAHLTTTTTSRPITTSTTLATTTVRQGSQLTCPGHVLSASVKTSNFLIVSVQHKKCYLFVETPALSWHNAEQACNRLGGHLVTVHDDFEEGILYNYIKSYGYPTWIGLTDQVHEGQYQWASGKPMTYQNWHTGSNSPYYKDGADCVVIDNVSTKWLDTVCTSTLPYFCEFDAVYAQNNVATSPRVTQPPQTTPPASMYFNQGNIHLCPSHIYREALSYYNGKYLAQYGSWCYELFVGWQTPWSTAESTCRSRGGTLVHIQNQQQQNFIEAFTSRYSPQHAVWIGLHDINSEGYYQWTSGARYSYNNFVYGHIGNQNGNRYSENCVVLEPFQNGQWDDVPCGYTDMYGSYSGYIHSPFCQYQITTTNPQLIGK